MIKINLLPPEYEAAQSRKEQRVIFLTIALVAISVLAVAWALLSRKAARLEADVVEAEQRLQQFQNIVNEMQTIEAAKNQLLSRRDVIRNLNRNRLIYPVFFEDLLPTVPGDIWINNIQIAEQGSQMKITMNSSASSNYALATWLANLQQSQHFSAVELNPISYTNPDEFSAQTLSFVVTCMYSHVGPMPLQEGAR